jgi:hypothetical protein
MKMDTNRMMINGVEYIRVDAVVVPAQHQVDGLRYAIVRSRDQGVMCGYVEGIDGRRVTLRQARQIYAYDSYFVLIEIAEFGPRNPGRMRMSVAMSETSEMLEACGVLYCTDTAGEALRSVEAERHD